MVVVDVLVFKSSQGAVCGFPASGCRWVLKLAFRCQTRSFRVQAEGRHLQSLAAFLCRFLIQAESVFTVWGRGPQRGDKGAGPAGLGATWFLLWVLRPPVVCSFAWHGHQVQASGRNLQSAPGPCQPSLSEPSIDQVRGWSQGPSGTAALPPLGTG